MRSTLVFVTMVMVAVVQPTVAQDRNVADYDIDVRFDAETHTLDGAQTIRWRNTSGVATSEIWFHLYLNAFAGSETTFMRELGGGVSRSGETAEREWGWTRLTSLRLANGTDLLPELTFERPDDGNESDFSVARVALPREVLPGESVSLEMAFEARLPKVVSRTGFAGEFHMVGQWFPKVAVFEGEAGWNCHQFHLTSEFFADFGSYRVRITIPRGWVIGATGEQISREPVATEDLVEFRAVDVHDFAWMTAPPDLMTVVEADFDPGRDVPIEWLDRARVLLDLGAADLELSPMTIRLLVPRSQESLAPRMLRATRLGIAWFGLFFGPYPQAGLTVVSPPPDAVAAGGMEYPTLITTGAGRFDAIWPMSRRKGIEAVTVHEIGHQYFQGLVASNEAERAWLDEGLAYWAENSCVEDIITDGLVPEILHPSIWGLERCWMSLERPPLIVDQPSWAYRRISDYFLASYTKTALALRTLEGLLGEARMARAMRAYFEAFRFRHPRGDDFRLALEEATGEDLGWFFDGVIRGGATADWAVLAVRHQRPRPAVGRQWREGAWHEIETEDGAGPAGEEGPWDIEIELGRLGDLVGEVEVELLWADGRRERRRWDGIDRWVRWREVSEERLQQVVVDPDVVWVLETRRADNYWRDEATESDRLWWFGGALRLVGFLTMPWS